MPTLISLLTGFFGAGGAIVNFFSIIFKKISITAIIMPIQITLLLSLYTAKISFLTALVTLVVWVYNRVVIILNIINNLGVNDNFSTVILFLKSIGFIQALNETFAYFSALLVSILVLILSKIVTNSLQSIADEYFKIGVLLQLGLK